ncbi:hypothetical protein N7495_001353 [Penicillium taxi]|uniref:uncharacterized protein n=1 Tax=Penicillium taxi TaxID=168475 RepID=UPI0025453443|nr:uncharacterized protein N7495_001353 [Penicillium taxi]KAJ5908671.1 hypothetical protein N7495_001353 [Penicillium taxi]
MNWPFRFHHNESGSFRHGRLFVYLALTASFLLLSYQFVLNRESLSSVSRVVGHSLLGHGHEGIEKELVFAAMLKSDMSWVDDNLPGWRTNIYRADLAAAEETEANLTVPMNKGNEAMVFLTYLIDRYSTLPDVVIFLHGGRYQWHNDNPLYDSLISIKDLHLNFVREAGYVNLRCTWPIGCPSELEPGRYLRDRPDDPQHPTAVQYPDSFMALFPGEEVPEVVGTPCCSQFAVSRDQVHRRERKEYEHARQWLLDSELDSATSGRIMEYAWHILFGKPPQHCPNATECYCKTYGYCNMNEEDLRQQWVWRGTNIDKWMVESRNKTA